MWQHRTWVEARSKVSVGRDLIASPQFVIPRNLLAVQVNDGMNGVRYASVWLSERSRMSPTQAKRGLSGPPSAFLDAGREQILLSGD